MLLAFGEIMMRIGPGGVLRFRQVLPGRLVATFGGGEANVCAGLAMLGRPTRYLTALPRHAVAQGLVDSLRGLGIDTDCILRRDEGRLGLYFVEKGANQRSSQVVYDRQFSAVSLAEPEEYDFQAALSGVTRLHITGITPALSDAAFRATRSLARMAKDRGVTVSCDLNFRKKLWRWRPGVDTQTLARECMSQILPSVDLVIGNEEDAEKVLGIHATGTSVDEGKINAGAYRDVAQQIHQQFPNISQVGITLRESISASHNNWGAMLYDAKSDQAFFAPLDADGNYQSYQIKNIVDRVGGGDAFAGALIFALTTPELSDLQTAVKYAVAASCLKHSIKGDFNYATRSEVEALMGGSASGRVVR
jgi:2-dehydro-3-deoxygluconokinase